MSAADAAWRASLQAVSIAALVGSVEQDSGPEARGSTRRSDPANEGRVVHARCRRFAPGLRLDKLQLLPDRRGIHLLEIAELPANAPHFRSFRLALIGDVVDQREHLLVYA
ncbi:hypothetical protein OG453_36440 [Streptomyces sp. NBC_01381]|uniref:hypothetical protein n=1 Tax=Streptomyces sp. NBC_01381 TaxID=2903845 RepID=UPI0022524540|nr:hypothetical protein [Streptomyces sp. NBC_01381]MCX4672102.1 hypothetical protein [Streptomyces sp. NBC_01381]